MATFTYQARSADGRAVNGQLQAEDEAGALGDLVRRGLTPLVVRNADAAPSPALRAGRPGRATLGDKRVVVQELATLLGAGISLSEALPSLASAYRAQAVGPALADVDRDVRAGQQLSAALRASALGLPAYVLALVEAGEASGALSAALTDAAAQMEHEQRVGQELRSALVYPTVLVLSGFLAVLVIFVGVVPRFAGLLKSARADVPAISRWVIESGLYVKSHLLPLGLGAAAIAGGLVILLSNAAVRHRLLNAMSRLPLIGAWLVRVEVGRWATVLGTLLGNRVPVIAAIALSAGALRLKRLQEDLSGAEREIGRGRMLSDVLAQCGWFPPTRLNLVRVGERSGELPRMLQTLGTMETEAARALQKRVLALIEPLAILGIGAVIGFIMIAVMMAITSLNTVAL